MISQEAIKEFKELYFQEYRIELTDEQVLDYGTRLIALIKAVYGKKLPKIKFVDKDNRRENN